MNNRVRISLCVNFLACVSQMFLATILRVFYFGYKNVLNFIIRAKFMLGFIPYKLTKCVFLCLNNLSHKLIKQILLKTAKNIKQILIVFEKVILGTIKPESRLEHFSFLEYGFTSERRNRISFQII